MSLKCTSYCLNWSLILCQSLCPLFCGMFLLLTHKSTLGPWKPILRTNAFSSIPQLLSPSPSTLITQTGTATFPTILQTPTTTLCFTMLILWVVFTLGFQWTFWAVLLLSGRHNRFGNEGLWVRQRIYKTRSKELDTWPDVEKNDPREWILLPVTRDYKIPSTYFKIDVREGGREITSSPLEAWTCRWLQRS